MAVEKTAISNFSIRTSTNLYYIARYIVPMEKFEMAVFSTAILSSCSSILNVILTIVCSNFLESFTKTLFYIEPTLILIMATGPSNLTLEQR